MDAELNLSVKNGTNPELDPNRKKQNFSGHSFRRYRTARVERAYGDDPSITIETKMTLSNHQQPSMYSKYAADGQIEADNAARLERTLMVADRERDRFPRNDEVIAKEAAIAKKNADYEEYKKEKEEFEQWKRARDAVCASPTSAMMRAALPLAPPPLVEQPMPPAFQLSAPQPVQNLDHILQGFQAVHRVSNSAAENSAIDSTARIGATTTVGGSGDGGHGGGGNQNVGDWMASSGPDPYHREKVNVARLELDELLNIWLKQGQVHSNSSQKKKERLDCNADATEMEIMDKVNWLSKHDSVAMEDRLERDEILVGIVSSNGFVAPWRSFNRRSRRFSRRNRM